MTTSSYMHDVIVEVAFNAGVRTPAASYVWTDISAYVELDQGLEIVRGRQDQFSTCDANTLNLVLDNRDGRFTAGLASGAYYPNVKIRRPIRVRATRPGGASTTRFVGFVDEWPVSWDGSQQASYVQITATSRMAVLGRGRKLKSIVEEEFLLDGPVAYYTLGEAEGATAASDSSGNAAPDLEQVGAGTSVVFGSATGPGTDGLTAATFAAGKYLLTTASLEDPWTLSFFFSASPGADGDLVTGSESGIKAAAAASGVTIVNGDISGYADPAGFGGTVTAVGSYDDGLVHHVGLVHTGAVLELFVDGVSAGTTAATTGSVSALVVGEALAGSVSHVALYDYALSSTRVSAHAAAGADGFEDDLPGDRLERYATIGGVPSAEVDADSGTSPMAHIDTTDKSVLELMRLVETTEGGVLFDGKDGVLEFRSRSSRYLASSSFTLDFNAQQIEADFRVQVDDSAIQNDVTATLSDGTVSAHAVDSTSVDAYDAQGDDIELHTTDANEPHGAAWWRVNAYADPTPRAPYLAVDVLALSTALQDSIMAADVGTRFATSNAPSQAPASTGDYFIEGITETYGPESVRYSLNVSDAAVYISTLVLDSATRGLLDTNVLAY